MLRAATLEDVDACLVMCRRFYEESGLTELPYDETAMRATLGHLIASDDGALIVDATPAGLSGMAAAIAYPAYFGQARMAQELFWWVDPKARGGLAGIRLLRKLEAWAKERGCASLTMICLPIDSPAESVYQRSGYRPAERSYIKGL